MGSPKDPKSSDSTTTNSETDSSTTTIDSNMDAMGVTDDEGATSDPSPKVNPPSSTSSTST